jgi:methyl-accepting chemotaxis protein
LVGRLHLKILIVVGGVVGLVMALLVAANLYSQRENLTANVQAAAVRVADATYAGLARPMEAGDGASIAQQLAQSAQTMPGVEIHLVDTELNVVFSSTVGAAGKPLARQVADPQILAAATQALGPSAAERDLELRALPPMVLRPIRNSESCYHCHGQSRAVLGGLLVRQTVDEVGDRLAAAVRLNLAFGLAGVLLVVGLVFVLLSSLVLRPLTEISRVAQAISSGDLTCPPRRDAASLAQRLGALAGEDEIERLGKGFDQMSESLRAILRDLKASTADLDREASGALAAAARQSSMAAQQSAAVHETSAVVAEIAQTSKLSTEHADQVAGICDRSEETARFGQQAVSEAMAGLEKLAGQVMSIARSITELSERTRRIGEIVSSVEDLSDQSNLLALNAAIEAARAGELGKGFAVVAAEMRNLATQSKASAGQVRRLLSELLVGTRAAVSETEEGSRRAREAAALAQTAGQSIAGMTGAMRESSAAAKQIATNTRQQTIGVEQIVIAVAELAAAANEAVQGTARMEEVAEGLGGVSKRLSGLMGRFKA